MPQHLRRVLPDKAVADDYGDIPFPDRGFHRTVVADLCQEQPGGGLRRNGIRRLDYVFSHCRDMVLAVGAPPGAVPTLGSFAGPGKYPVPGLVLPDLRPRFSHHPGGLIARYMWKLEWGLARDLKLPLKHPPFRAGADSRVFDFNEDILRADFRYGRIGTCRFPRFRKYYRFHSYLPYL